MESEEGGRQFIYDQHFVGALRTVWGIQEINGRLLKGRRINRKRVQRGLEESTERY